MVVSLYNIRDNGVHDRDPYKMYKLESTLFSIKLHYGGVFTKSPNRKYINGNITFVDMIDSDEFSVHEIDSMLEDLGQDGHRVMFYHFLKPGCDLDNGLEPIACDRDVVVLGNYVSEGLKLVEVFVEHEKTNPDIYTPPKAKRIVIEELDAKPIISKAGITPVARKIVFDVTNNQTCGKEKGKNSRKDLDGKSSGKDLEGKSSAVGNDGSYEESQDPNFDPFADLDLILPTMGDWEGNTSEHVDLGDETNNVETECNDDERHRVEETQGDDDRHGEEQTGDNNVDDINVDMADFEYNIDEDVEFGGCRDREEASNGIIPAIANLFPNAEHRYCVKHIHENFKKDWKGEAYKLLLWRAAKATTIPDFQLAMEELKEFNNEAYEWLNAIPPQHWTRSHFSVRAKSDVLLNNMCEVFNGKLVSGRDRPIIATLEFAREYLMKRSAPATDKRRGTSQLKKATIATRSSTAKDKGKAPVTSGGVAKKTTPRKKIVNLG
ncbi:hypothetical protein Tco_0204153 [Tanacetum coccineum]